MNACPLCKAMPEIAPNVRGDWSGGCKTPGCPFSDFVHQPTKDQAIAQWGDVVGPFYRTVA